MKATMQAPQVCTDIVRNGSATRFDGLASREWFVVDVAYHEGHYEAPERPFLVIDGITAHDTVLLESEHCKLIIERGADLWDLFTREQIESMEIRLMAQISAEAQLNKGMK